MQNWDSGTLAFQYDANGNMTRIQDVSRSSTWSLTYDESNRVMSLYEPGMTAFRYRYRYNADGQRYHKQQLPYAAAPGPAQYYALDGNTTVGFFPLTGLGYWNIMTPSGEVIGRMTTGGAASYYLKDHLGSVRAVVNASGTVLETRDYYPFGLEMPGRSFVSGTKAKENFTGHELDAESGLIYAGARYYMPNIGRWTSVDPLADQYPAWSPYNYTLNNPLRFVDPHGKAPVLPWVLRGAWSAYRAYTAGQAAAATASTVVAAHMTAEVLREGMSQVEVGVGAPPISGIDAPSLVITTTDKTRVDAAPLSMLDAPGVESLGIVLSTAHPLLDGTGKVHGEIPSYIPDDWTPEDLEQLRNDLPTSIQTRQQEAARLGEDGPHRERLRQEQTLLRQIEKRLSGS